MTAATDRASEVDADFEIDDNGTLVRQATRPFMRLNYQSVVGLLDPGLRDKLGVSWSARDERELEQGYKLVRTAYRVLPDPPGEVVRLPRAGERRRVVRALAVDNGVPGDGGRR